jgi:hypothetical protein
MHGHPNIKFSTDGHITLENSREKCTNCANVIQVYILNFIYSHIQLTLLYIFCHSFLIFNSLQMDLTRKFEETTSNHTVRISASEIKRKYPILEARRSVTKYGPTVLLSKS